MSLTLEQKFQEAERNESYAIREFNTIRSRYPDEYVGILDGQIRYHNKKLDDLLARIRADRGSTEGVLVLYVPDKPATVIV